MKAIFTFLLVVIGCSLSAYGQAKQQSVQVKIIHQKKVLLDTVIYEQGKQAISAVEKIVSNYTNNPIFIDASQVRELYVFNIESIKSKTKAKTAEPLVVNIDSLLNSLVVKIEKVMNDSTVNAVKDSINHSLQEMKRAIKSIDKKDVQKAKDDFKEFVGKVKETRIIIIQEGDTIRIPKGNNKQNEN